MDTNSKIIGEFRADFSAAIAPLQEKYGATITLDHITYCEEYFSSRLKVVNGTDPETTATIYFDADVWKFGHLGLRPGMYKRFFKGVDGVMCFIRSFNLLMDKCTDWINRFAPKVRFTIGSMPFARAIDVSDEQHKPLYLDVRYGGPSI